MASTAVHHSFSVPAGNGVVTGVRVNRILAWVWPLTWANGAMSVVGGRVFS